jgi:hypothetical protein
MRSSIAIGRPFHCAEKPKCPNRHAYRRSIITNPAFSTYTFDVLHVSPIAYREAGVLFDTLSWCLFATVRSPG